MTRHRGLRLSTALLLAWSAAATGQSDGGARTLAGTLAAGDAQLRGGEHVDWYALDGARSQAVTLDLSSSGFDPYLIVTGPNGFDKQNDDDHAASGTDARLELVLPRAGRYRVGVTSYRNGETGPYRLRVAGADLIAEAASPADGAAPTLELGRATDGRLADGDGRLDSGEYVDNWLLRAPPGSRVAIGMTSGDIDPYLLVRGTGVREDNDDAPGGRGTDARVEATVPADGVLRIGATSFRTGESGRYRLLAERIDGEGGTRGVVADAGRLVPGRDVAGRLDEEARYTLAGRAGQRIEVVATSSAFDPIVHLDGPAGFRAENDDDPAGGTRDSRLAVTLPADGVYTVRLTAYDGRGGAYRLALGEAAAAGAASAGGALALGREQAGEIGEGDATLTSGEWVDWYEYRGTAGERVSITAASDSFDTYLLARAAGGAQEENDDAFESGGTDSRLDWTLPETGTYRIGVTSYRPGERGRYRLAVARGAPEPTQAVADDARIFAVSVGVADYPGDGNDLPRTDQDAVKLNEALEQTGRLHPASIVLTNASATRGALRQALSRVAAAARPQDLVVFFYSGHGSQVERAGGGELDGRAETIDLHDGQLLDADLEQMMAPIRARMLIALDSCFSGGFRNLVNRPGVMGMFSSEEDLTSTVADKYEAGGFLSHFLRAGLTGEADADDDRQITAGELSHYVRQRFYGEAPIEARSADRSRNYQNLIVERGGVPVNQVLLRR